MLGNLDNEVIFKKAFTNKIVFTAFVNRFDSHPNRQSKNRKLKIAVMFSPKNKNKDKNFEVFFHS